MGRADRDALLELKGHTDGVSSASFSPDGTRIVTGSEDKTAKVWDAGTGTPLLELKGHTARSERSRRSARTGRGSSPAVRRRTAKVWDARTGTPLLDLKGHTVGVTSASFSPDGTRIVTGSWDDGRRRCGTRGREPPCSNSRGTRTGCMSASFSPDGTRIVTGSEDETAKVWDARTGTPLLDSRATRAPCTSASFSPDGTRIVTGSGDDKRSGEVWDARTGTPLLELKGHTDRMIERGVQPGRHADRHRQCGQDGEGLGRADRARLLLDLKGHTDSVTSACVQPGRHADRHRRVVTGRRRSGTRARVRPCSSSKAHGRRWRARRSAPTARGSSPAVRTRRRRCGTRGRARPSSNSRGTRARCGARRSAPTASRIVTGESRTGRRRSGTRGRATPLLELKGHTDERDRARRSAPTGRGSSPAAGDRTAKVWDARTGTRPARPQGAHGPVSARVVQPRRDADRHRQW